MVDKPKNNKDIYYLRNWHFSSRDCKGKIVWVAKGNVYYNPKFREGLYLHTSVIKNISIGDSYLDVYTKNSHYRCLFAESMEERFKFIYESKLFDEGVNESDLDTLKEKIISEVKAKKKIYEDKLHESFHNEKECLIMVFSDKEDYYFKDFIIKINDKMIHYGMHPHIGMFQDSILIMGEFCESKDYDEEIDFRYFPFQGNRISFYSWEGYYGNIYAINQGEKEFEIDTPYGKYLLQPNSNAYLISADTLEGRITEPIAPEIDLYNVWNVNVDDNGIVGYIAPNDDTDKKG